MKDRRRVVKWMVVLSLLLALTVVTGVGIARARARAARTAQEAAETGIVIVSVVPDGPAAQAGVARGDILLKIDDQTVDRPADLARYLAKLEAGDEVTLTVLHGDEERTLTATLGERQPYLGLVLCSEPGPLVAVEIPPLRLGAAVTQVVPGSPADAAGLQEGDIIIAVDGQQVDVENDLADLIAAHRPGDEVMLEVQRPGEDEPLEIEVALGAHPDDEDRAYLGVSYLPRPRVEWFREDVPLPKTWYIPRPLDRLFPEGMPFVLPPDRDLTQGVIVRAVAEDSPAADAGLEEGDIITAVDGEPLAGPQALVEAIADRKPGDTVTLTVYRRDAGEEQEIEVTLAENPEREGAAYLGVTVGGFFQLRRFEGEGPFRRFFDFDRAPIERDDWPRLRLFGFPLQLRQFFKEFPFKEWDRLPQRFEFHFSPELEFNFSPEPFKEELKDSGVGIFFR
jgi:S1-C subfamily serine protease